MTKGGRRAPCKGAGKDCLTERVRDVFSRALAGHEDFLRQTQGVALGWYALPFQGRSARQAKAKPLYSK